MSIVGTDRACDLLATHDEGIDVHPSACMREAMKACTQARQAREGCCTGLNLVKLALGFGALSMLALAACRGGGLDRKSLPPLAATSAHFRYHSWTPTAHSSPESALKAMEQHRLDISEYLGLKETDLPTVIDYYFFGDDTLKNGASPCPPQYDCVVGRSIYTVVEFDEHELIHAYLLEKGRSVLLAEEGIAEGLRCSPLSLSAAQIPTRQNWYDIAALDGGASDLYGGALRLFVEEIEEFGVGAFMRYYRRAHPTLDPALFGMEFQQEFGVPIETVWSRVGRKPRKVCPCLRESLSSDAGQTEVSSLGDYRLLPKAKDGLVLRSSAALTSIGNCSTGWFANLEAVNKDGYPIGHVSLASLQLDDSQYYASVTGPGQLGLAADGPHLSTTCDTSAAFSVPPGFWHWAVVMPPGLGNVSWYVPLAGAGTVTHWSKDVPVRLCEGCADGCGISIPPEQSQSLAPLSVLNMIPPPSSEPTIVVFGMAPTP